MFKDQAFNCLKGKLNEEDVLEPYDFFRIVKLLKNGVLVEQRVYKKLDKTLQIFLDLKFKDVNM